jgi:hypothetical protein
MKRTGHTACTAETTNAYKVLIVKFHTKILLGRHGHGTERVCECVQWTKLALAMVRRQSPCVVTFCTIFWPALEQGVWNGHDNSKGTG